MGDMGDIFNDWRAHKRAKKAERVEEKRPFVEWLRSVSATWTHLSGGYEAGIADGEGYLHRFQYWPGSGKWAQIRHPTIYRTGERHLRAAVTALKETPDARP